MLVLSVSPVGSPVGVKADGLAPSGCFEATIRYFTTVRHLGGIQEKNWY